MVAEKVGIELENAPLRMLEDLNGFCTVIHDWVNEEQDSVSEQVKEFNIQALLERIPQRLQLQEQIKKYDDLDQFNSEKLWETYKVVVPFVGESGIPRAGLN